MTWRLVLVHPPTVEPLDLDYVKDSVLRVVNGSLDDEFIANQIKAAREVYEDETGKAAMSQTWQLILDGFPSGAIELPRPPLLSVPSIDYVDADGVLQTLAGGSPATFTVLPSGKYTPGRVVPLSGASWPSTFNGEDAVTITYLAGYASAYDVPEMVKAGIGLLVSELYKNRSLSMENRLTASVVNTARFWKRVY